MQPSTLLARERTLQALAKEHLGTAYVMHTIYSHWQLSGSPGRPTLIDQTCPNSARLLHLSLRCGDVNGLLALSRVSSYLRDPEEPAVQVHAAQFIAGILDRVESMYRELVRVRAAIADAVERAVAPGPRRTVPTRLASPRVRDSRWRPPDLRSQRVGWTTFGEKAPPTRARRDANDHVRAQEVLAA